jgi:subtilisin family serine protease
MNRQNFFGHLALALTLILVAAFVGQIRRWQREASRYDTSIRTAPPATAPILPRRDKAEVLVRFRSGTTLEKIKAAIARLHDRLEDRMEMINSNLAVIADEDGLSAEAVAAEYRRLPDVEYAEPNFTIQLEPLDLKDAEDTGDHEAAPGGGARAQFDARIDRAKKDWPAAEHTQPAPSVFAQIDRHMRLRPLPETMTGTNVPNDPLFGEQWSLENSGQRDGKVKADISALQAWTKTRGSDEVVVAVLDSGVDYTHPDLAANIWVRPANIAPYTDDDLGTVDDVHGYNAVDNNGDPMDENGHGTHCAGIIGAEGGNSIGIAGINWKAQIMPLKFMSKSGFGTTKDAVEAINYVINRKKAGVNVRIISASWGSTQRSRALEDAIRRAGEEGILFVAASGNASTDADKVPHYPASYELPNVISVAALNRHDMLASFSNYGAKRVHIAAPGAEIMSTWLKGEYEEHSGTSMATPEVSGVAALVLSVDPDLTVKELRERLLNSVDKLDTLRGKVSSGGRLNAARAVNAD